MLVKCHGKLPFCFNSLNFSSDIKFAGKMFHKCFLGVLMYLSHVFDFKSQYEQCERQPLLGVYGMVFSVHAFLHETWNF